MKKIALLAFALVLLSTAIVWGFIRPTVAHTNESNSSYGDGKSVFASSKTIWVPDNFTSIQEAINNASDGDTIFVRSDTYAENVIVNKSLTLQGEDKGATIIQSAAPDKPCISITNDSVKVNNFTVRNAWNTTAWGMWFSNGISVFQSNNVTLSDLIVYNNTGFGIWFMGGNNTEIHDNNLYNNTYGLVAMVNVTSSTSHAIHHNDVYNSTIGMELWAMEGGLITNSAIHHNNLYNISFVGMFLGVSEGGSLNNTEVCYNNVSNTPYGIFTMIDVNGSVEYTNIHDNNVFDSEYGIGSRSNNTIIRDNTVYNCTLFGIAAGADNRTHIMYNSIVSNEIHHCGYFGIALFAEEGGSLSHSNVSYNDIHHNDYYGILLMGSVNNSAIHHNEAYNNTLHGMGLMFGPANNHVYQNKFYNNTFIGIHLDQADNNVLSNNEISGNGNGIWINGTSNKIIGNDITNNHYAIWLEGSSNNRISRNSLSNSEWGIGLKFASNNTIFGNNMKNNDYAIWLEYSSDNTIYHNNFIDNIQQVTIYDSTNVWDDGVEGNYWSNYTGADSNHDGIGDSPHFLDGNNTDNYPLMGMFHSFNTSLGYYVNVISNSTIEDFQYFESNSTIKMYVSNMTANQTLGFCRVRVPHVLMDPDNIWIAIDYGQTEVLFANFTLYDNGTHRWIYFAYPHSMHEILLGEDSTPPLIENVYQQPAEDSVYPDDKVEVYANVTDNLSGVKQVILNYTTNNGTWFSINMTNLEGNLYNATIPQYSYCTNVTYVIIAEDNANNTITTEEMGHEYQYHVIPEFPTWTSMLLIFIILTVAIAIYKRRPLKTPIH